MTTTILIDGKTDDGIRVVVIMLRKDVQRGYEIDYEIWIGAHPVGIETMNALRDGGTKIFWLANGSKLRINRPDKHGYRATTLDGKEVK